VLSSTLPGGARTFLPDYVGADAGAARYVIFVESHGAGEMERELAGLQVSIL